MLVLTRKQSQRVFIGNDTIIEVLETRSHSVKLGITAPEQVKVLREELRSTLAQVNRESVAESSPAVEALWNLMERRQAAAVKSAAPRRRGGSGR